MTSTGFEVFDETVQKTNTLLKTIEAEFDWTNHRNISYAALRSVLHVLRDRLTVEEAAQLAAQLPLLVKGIFYDGWDPSIVPRKIDKEEFVEEVRRRFIYSMDRDIADLIAVVIKALRKYVSQGELEDVLSILPKDLSLMLKQLEIQ
jgi:uncharacterized protein (DUF2267 family)